MELRVIGCHGGESPKHRASCFLLDDVIAIDAGSLTSGLDLRAQCCLQAVVVSHAHMDHIRDLATLADNRAQNGCRPLVVAGTRATLRALRRHFFNGQLWPDFTAIPSRSEPTIRYMPMRPEKESIVGRYAVRPVLVNHTIESAGFVFERGGASLGYSGDTGPTDRLWQVLDEEPNLRALIMEVSFPNRRQHLATISGHHTPRTLAADLQKYRLPDCLPTLLYHVKPTFQAEVEREVARIKGLDLTVLRIGDHFVL